ncbi:hypothetical protein AVEN_87929-1 [Araneus ventricosus]|uniref:DUF7041 domain-containing protein n=1 Tax=Araneus ventricosus TaxID=182803 RepID=A0A4Y2UT75_ARAVE|nr:hypothetical protein AVEN_87929-1 [Araneus ventricosus]
MTEVGAVKIPPYNFSYPHLWFAMCDRSLGLEVLKPVTDNVTKFNYIVSNLQPEADAFVRDVIMNPDAVDPCAVIKTQLIYKSGESSQKEIRKLVSERN